jgi:hypothetical protein
MRARLKGREMTDDDPNEAYEVVPIEPGPHGRSRLDRASMRHAHPHTPPID